VRARPTIAARRRRGLTLVETMVSVSILLVMSAIVYASMNNAIQFQNLLSARDETIRTARAAMAKLTRDFQLAYLTFNTTSVNVYQTVFVGLDEDPSKVFFTSLNHQRMYLNSRECDQTEITVWTEQSPPEKGQGYVLFHREAPRIDELPDEQGRIWPLAYNVRAFHLRYLDPLTQQWTTEWDTRKTETLYRYPRAVEIGLVLIAPDPNDLTGESTVDVPFLDTVIVEYSERIPSRNQLSTLTPEAQAAAAQGGLTAFPPGTVGGRGGMWGAGATGASSGYTAGALMGGGMSGMSTPTAPTGGTAPSGPSPSGRGGGK
jgi:prepilin-type N-terminal cleavage/methylation domain-containing protein